MSLWPDVTYDLPVARIKVNLNIPLGMKDMVMTNTVFILCLENWTENVYDTTCYIGTLGLFFTTHAPRNQNVLTVGSSPEKRDWVLPAGHQIYILPLSILWIWGTETSDLCVCEPDATQHTFLSSLGHNGTQQAHGHRPLLISCKV